MKRLIGRIANLEAAQPKPAAVNPGTPILTREDLPEVLRILAEVGPPPGEAGPADPTMPADATCDELAAWLWPRIAGAAR